ncbi:nucleoside-diphosphate-sugar epimerase family protein [Sclerotinia borealis F-4128]|uniref:Nucleoside-diphosphate-sugar epimerase family protein n=1 Tax=Sclerotinia borealis (strain F-4128) TaxID=1432307 RepID=W9C204_SCLBF|nr:nucleoside-diphosphate-sugar epimerase family protein [Sclerotinia borealis F-4128]
MSWTILRPVTFMENLTPNFEGKAFAKMWQQVGSRPIQLVSVHDIGIFAAKALLSPTEYAGRKLGIAGDSLNYEEGKRIFKQVTGKEMPETFCVVGKLVKRVVDPDVGSMFRWFEKEGFGVDIERAREVVPVLRDFSTWLRDGSGFVGLWVLRGRGEIERDLLFEGDFAMSDRWIYE